MDDPQLRECPRCLKRVPARSAFCRRCGVPLRPTRAALGIPRHDAGAARPAGGGLQTVLMSVAAAAMVSLVVGAFFAAAFRHTAHGPFRVTPVGAGGGRVTAPVPPSSPPSTYRPYRHAPDPEPYSPSRYRGWPDANPYDPRPRPPDPYRPGPPLVRPLPPSHRPDLPGASPRGGAPSPPGRGPER